MVFGLFRAKKRPESIAELLAGFSVYQKMMGQIAQAASLEKLNRNEEARNVWQEAERLASNYQRENANDKMAHVILAMFFVEAKVEDKAESTLTSLLSSSRFSWTEEERLILKGQLQAIQRERPIGARHQGEQDVYTQVYCCQNCGRLHNYLSMPCPNCDWYPPNIDEMARSLVLSNALLDVPLLTKVCLELSKGRKVDDVVPNLREKAKTCLADKDQRKALEKMYSMLIENEAKNHRSIPMLRECGNCGERITFSDAEACDQCQAPVRWPDAVRTLVCLDNLLWFIEQWVEGPWSEHMSELTCLWVRMANNLLRKQQVPTDKERQYALTLISKINGFTGPNKSAYVEIKSPNDIQIHLVKSTMTSDTESYAMFLYMEIQRFIHSMAQGVRL